LRDRAILELLYASGMRVSELVGLNDDQLDLDQHTIRVLGKGKKERVVLFGSFAADSLLEYLNAKKRLRLEESTTAAQSRFSSVCGESA
jgi:integrase/recombinase XerC